MAEVALINGIAYDYTRIIVNILGVPVKGITEVNYVQEQEKTNNFGTGEKAHSRGRGPKDTSGSFGIAMNEVEALRAVAPNGNLLDIPPFDVTIFFDVTGKTKKHTLTDVEFTNDGVESSQGDTDIARTFDIVIGDLEYQTT
ncbi:MAG: hypothetical protein GY861_05535 [bacterium]|nr:hypothetical protein [bacterium]